MMMKATSFGPLESHVSLRVLPDSLLMNMNARNADGDVLCVKKKTHAMFVQEDLLLLRLENVLTIVQKKTTTKTKMMTSALNAPKDAQDADLTISFKDPTV